MNSGLKLSVSVPPSELRGLRSMHMQNKDQSTGSFATCSAGEHLVVRWDCAHYISEQPSYNPSFLQRERERDIYIYIYISVCVCARARACACVCVRACACTCGCVSVCADHLFAKV